jgi:glutamine synthetase
MGLLNNYEIINPFVSATNDAFNRLKPGYEAPVSAVTSLGISKTSPSRNRTVLAGVVRDVKNPMATRFELRSPNAHSDTYLVLAASYMAMMDGIEAALSNEKTSEELERSISKHVGEEDFYLDTDRAYRSEKNVFTEYDAAERDRLFGRAPRTVYENLCAFEDFPKKTEILKRDGVLDDLILESYRIATLNKWQTDLLERIMPNTRKLIRKTVKVHRDNDCVDYDVTYWSKIDKIRKALGQDTLEEQCLLTKISIALHTGEFEKASQLQLEMQSMIEDLQDLYSVYVRNIF